MPGGSAVTVEPGGAVDFPARRRRRDGRDQGDGRRPGRLRKAFAAAGLGLVLLGADPLRPASASTPARATGDGTVLHGQRHRRRGCGDDDVDGVGSGQPRRRAAGRWADRVRLAHALGPTMVAISANSPLLSGNSPAGVPPAAGLEQLDRPERADPPASGDDPGTDWAVRAEGAGDAGNGRGEPVTAASVRRFGGRPRAARRRRPTRWTWNTT